MPYIRKSRLAVPLFVALLLASFLTPVEARAAKEEQDVAPVRVAPRLADPSEYPIGEQIADVSFVDIDGESARLSDYSGTRAVVLLMHSLECPLSKKMSPKIGRLQKELASAGAAVLVVNPIEGVTPDAAKAFCAEYGLENCRYVLDPKGTLARALDARTTTDTFVIDPSRTLRYRGAFDDQYGLGYSLDAPRIEPLRDAIRSVVDRKLPSVEAMTAPGCALDLGEHERPAVPVTYHDRVSRILQRNCQSCHRSGESAPFELSSYEDAKKVKGMMRYVLENRLMPPWFAEGGEHAWGNAPALTERDRADVLSWIEAGCPKGDEKNAVTPIDWIDGWRIGEPDLVVQVPRVFRIPAEGTIDYQYARVRLPIEKDKWVQAMEIRPTAPQVVHHVLVLVQYPRRHEKDLVQPEFEDGIGGYFAVMVPGQTTNVFPDGMAKFLPRGSSLIFQIHYTAIGKEAEDQTRLAFRFADEAPEREMQTKGVAEVRFAIPPGAKNHEVSASYRFDEDAAVFGFFPHMHLRGKSFRYEMRYPDGRSELLLDIPRYDFNWQLFYRLREPLEVPAGAVIRVTGWFDNSADNPANPDSSKTVRFGEQTWEEMMIGYFDWTSLGS